MHLPGGSKPGEARCEWDTEHCGKYDWWKASTTSTHFPFNMNIFCEDIFYVKMELLPKFFSAEVCLDVLSSYVSHPVSSGWIRKYALHSRGEILDMWFWGEKSCESQSCKAESQTSGSGAQTNPVIPSIIVSTGPPLLHATTGFPAAMASKGTMPKCSFTGVYKTQEQREINIAFSSELIDWSMTTSWNSLRSRASLHYTKH